MLDKRAYYSGELLRQAAELLLQAASSADASISGPHSRLFPSVPHAKAIKASIRGALDLVKKAEPEDGQ